MRDRFLIVLVLICAVAPMAGRAQPGLFTAPYQDARAHRACGDTVADTAGAADRTTSSCVASASADAEAGRAVIEATLSSLADGAAPGLSSARAAAAVMLWLPHERTADELVVTARIAVAHASLARSGWMRAADMPLSDSLLSIRLSVGLQPCDCRADAAYTFDEDTSIDGQELTLRATLRARPGEHLDPGTLAIEAGPEAFVTIGRSVVPDSGTVAARADLRVLDVTVA